MSTYDFVQACQCEKCAGAELAHDSFVLYVCAATHSIGTANPGFVPDSFLDSHPVDTTTAAIELRMENRWIRQCGGYQIVHNPLVDAVQASRDRVARDIVICRQAGAAPPEPTTPNVAACAGYGWTTTSGEASDSLGVAPVPATAPNLALLGRGSGNSSSRRPSAIVGRARHVHGTKWSSEGKCHRRLVHCRPKGPTGGVFALSTVSAGASPGLYWFGWRNRAVRPNRVLPADRRGYRLLEK